MSTLPPPGASGWVPPPPPPPLVASGWVRPPVFAGFWSRFGALVIDGLILGAAAALLFVPGLILLVTGYDDHFPGQRTPTVIGAAGGYREDRLGSLGVVGLLLVLAAFPVALAVGVWMAWREGTTGQSPGKKVLGIKVWRADGSGPIGGWPAIGRRAFAYFISGQILYLGYLWMLWDKPLRQTWHDKVVDSVVVEA